MYGLGLDISTFSALSRRPVDTDTPRQLSLLQIVFAFF